MEDGYTRGFQRGRAELKWAVRETLRRCLKVTLQVAQVLTLGLLRRGKRPLKQRQVRSCQKALGMNGQGVRRQVRFQEAARGPMEIQSPNRAWRSLQYPVTNPVRAEEAEACLPSTCLGQGHRPGGVSAVPGQPDPITDREAELQRACQASGTFPGRIVGQTQTDNTSGSTD